MELAYTSIIHFGVNILHARFIWLKLFIYNAPYVTRPGKPGLVSFGEKE